MPYNNYDDYDADVVNTQESDAKKRLPPPILPTHIHIPS
jgi:hypothetical protein